MRGFRAGAALEALGILLGADFPQEGGTASVDFPRRVRQILRQQEGSREDTFRAHNEALQILFREFAESSPGGITAERVRTFTSWVAEAGGITFEHYLEAVTTPRRRVQDPRSGASITVLGPLGSDLINPWLAAAGIVDGAALPEQPMYRLASHALREHTDFALIGVADPTIRFERLPAELRDRARAAYAGLNPTGVFRGGFDHPLFYAVVRETARKLFREDYPEARLDMARLVQPESRGGFGIRSCLFCHGQDPEGVYSRLLAQQLYLEPKAGRADVPEEDRRKFRREAELYSQAARTVLETHPDRIDASRVRALLGNRSSKNLEALKPGYDDFAAVLGKLGCLSCHGSGAHPPAEFDPAAFEAYVLEPSSYAKMKNIALLAELIDFENPDRSRILRKAMASVRHRGSRERRLNSEEAEMLREALVRWIQGP